MATIDQVKALRDETGVSIMLCKKALEEAGGDAQKAKVLLRKHSSNAAAKKSDRSLGAGVVQAYVHANNQVSGIVVLSCETDFVAKNETFVALARDIAMHVAAQNPEYLSRNAVDTTALAKVRDVFEEEIKNLPAAQANKPKDLREKILQGKIDTYFKDKILLEQAFIKNPDQTITDLINEAIQKFGERIEIVRFARYAV